VDGDTLGFSYFTAKIVNFDIILHNVGNYTLGRIAGDSLSSRKTARAECCTLKTTVAALDG
jgi:hypothetical protein